MTDGAAAHPPEPQNREPLSKVGGWLKAASLAGILAGAGFIVRFSREQFLGISLGVWNVQDLSILAGRCAIQSILLPASFLFRHMVILGICICGLLIFVLIVTVFCRKLNTRVLLKASGLVIVCLALFVVLLGYEIPTIQLNDWMTNGNPSQSQVPTGDDNPRSTYISRLLITSKLSEFNPVTAEIPASCFPGKALVPFLAQFGMKPQEAGDSIQTEYSVAVLVCICSWLYLSLRISPGVSTWLGRMFLRAEFVVLGLLVVVSFFIPYVYGKLISSTEFPLADIQYKESAPNATTEQDRVLTDELAVISATDKDEFVLSIRGGIARIIAIPRDHLLYLHLYGKRDIIQELVEQRARAATCSSAP